MAKVLIMRKPVVMEDEGRHFVVGRPMERATAERWIKEQAGQYFKPGDYYLVEIPELQTPHRAGREVTLEDVGGDWRDPDWNLQ